MASPSSTFPSQLLSAPSQASNASGWTAASVSSQSLALARIPLLEGRLESAGETETFLTHAQSTKWFSAAEPLDLPTAVEEGGDEVRPGAFDLAQNYPNPFNAGTLIRYHLPSDAEISLIVYDLAGQHVRTLDSGFKSAGQHAANWDGRDDNGRHVASGVYMYDFTTRSQELSPRWGKMVLLR